MVKLDDVSDDELGAMMDSTELDVVNSCKLETVKIWIELEESDGDGRSTVIL